MTIAPIFVSATPVLASLDIERSADFFATVLGFEKVYVAQGAYGVVRRGPVQIHFWACNDRQIAEATSCRIQVSGVRRLYEHCNREGIVHPNAHLQSKPWGSWEFAVLDPDGNLIVFHEPVAA